MADVWAEQRRWEEEMKLRCAKYERLQTIDAEKAKKDGSLAARTKEFVDSVKHVFVKLSDDPAELPMFLLIWRIYTRCMKFHRIYQVTVTFAYEKSSFGN